MVKVKRGGGLGFRSLTFLFPMFPLQIYVVASELQKNTLAQLKSLLGQVFLNHYKCFLIPPRDRQSFMQKLTTSRKKSGIKKGG